MEALCADHAGSRCRQALVRSVRSDQGVAARRLSADRSRRYGARPQCGRLFHRDRACSLLAIQHGVRHFLVAGPDAQARIFSYADAHRYRLGTHYEALPVNRPRFPVHNYHKDGALRFFDNNTKKPDAYYEPNSFDGPKENKRYAEPVLPLHGDADRYSHRDGNDDYSQPGNLFRLFSAE